MAAPTLSLPGVQDITATSARLKVTVTYTPPPPTIPSWVPAAGEVVTYTKGGGVLTNNFRDVADPNGIGINMFYAVKVQDYGGAFPHPDWREYGGYFFFGTGHSAGNYNGGIMLTLDENTIYFECVTPPTLFTNGFTGDVSIDSDAYGRRTGSSPTAILPIHSYGCGAFKNGVFIIPAMLAIGHTNVGSVQVAHELDLTNPATGYNSRGWNLRTTSYGTWSPFNAPIVGEYFPAQDRIIVATKGGGAPYLLQWFDCATNTWVTGTGTGWNYADSGIDSGALLRIDSRDLGVLLYRDGSGNVKVEYMNLASGIAQPTLGGTATLSTTLAIPTDWGAACWCEDSDRILIFGVTGNTDKVYEVEIPTNLGDPWPVTNHTLNGGQTIVPPTLGVWGKSLAYQPNAKCIVFAPDLLETGNDSVKVYRPRNT